MGALLGFIGDPHPWDQRPAFALDADVTVWWPEVRPCWEEAPPAALTPDPSEGGERG